MVMRRPTGGRGSNQYVSRPGSTMEDVAIRGRIGQPRPLNAVVTEEPPTAFTDDEADLFERLQDGDPIEPGEWEDAADHPWWEFRAQATYRDDCPPEVLAQLATPDGQPAKVWMSAARHPNCPPSALVELLRRFDSNHAAVAARHPQIPPAEVMSRLQASSWFYGADKPLADAAASNPALPAEIHIELAKRGNRNVYAAADWTPPEVLRVIAEDTSQRRQGILSKVASNPNCPPDLIETLSTYRSRDVKVGVAMNVNCPQPILDRLAHLKTDKIKEAVARNPSTRADTLDYLWRTGSRSLQRHVENNASCPEELRIAGAFTDSL